MDDATIREISGHSGTHAVAAARAHGIDTMFTLSGAHVFPLYDAAVKGDDPMRLVDVRHEATAVFAAEGMARLTRRPGLAVLTAGPGVTNGVSATRFSRGQARNRVHAGIAYVSSPTRRPVAG